jgi:Phage protein (N4 Gp49/phage Sf6 gene 66) family
MSDTLQSWDDQAAAVQKTPNRVTLEYMESRIATTEYLNPESVPQLTLAIVNMKNGFAVVGKSAPADPANFNKELGQKFAREDAMRQLWGFEGYALCERLRG